MQLARWLTLLVCLLPLEAYGCYAVIVGREASADGSVLVGHNEQNGSERILNFRRVPSFRTPPGGTVRLRRGGILPEVSQTAAFLWSELPGQEFSDAYLNEHGVAIVSDACRTREDSYDMLVSRGEIRQGGIGYMLRRLVAQRAKSAREGVLLAGELIERFGYVDSGRTYVIADTKEAWLLAVVRGRRWAAMRVPDDVVVVLPNIHIVGQLDLDDDDDYLASADLIDYAVKRGWYDPKDGEPFNFRKVYRYGWQLDRPDPRRSRGRGLVTGVAAPKTQNEPPPIGVRPKEKMTVATVAQILRDTAGSQRSISSPVTQEGAVFQLRDNMPKEIGCVYWRITAEPACSVLLPWYLGITQTPSSFYRPGDVKTQLTLDHHFHPPRGTFDRDPEMAWWTFKDLQDWVRRDFKYRAGPVQDKWSAFEDRLFKDQPGLEARMLAIWAYNPKRARQRLTDYCYFRAEEAIAQARKTITPKQVPQ